MRVFEAADTRVTDVGLDATAHRWTVRPDRGELVSARYLVMATGCLYSGAATPLRRRRQLHRPDLSHRPLAARVRGPLRLAHLRDHYRLLRHPGDPGTNRFASTIGLSERVEEQDGYDLTGRLVDEAPEPDLGSFVQSA